MITIVRRDTRTGLKGETGGRRPSATAVAALALTAAFAVLAWGQRWISNDGLIVARVVRQILAGNGPNTNPFQRAESSTSTLWTWLGAGAAGVAPGDVAVVLVVLGLVLAVAGLGLALAGSVAVHRGLGAVGFLAPAGALVVAAIAGFWDFATSGLETGLSLTWLGGLWWAFTRITPESSTRRLLLTAVLIGLGPLVRPDFALVTVVFGAALLWLARPGLRLGPALVGAAAALPVGYGIFRAGYYGLTVPLTAVAKEAGGAHWARGFGYLEDLFDTYHLLVPQLAICVLAVALLVRTPIERRSAVVLAAPVIAGGLMGLYILRVGGDYMHARMWLPVVFTMLLPLMVVPVGRSRRPESAAVVVLVVWALLAGLFARTPYQGRQYGPQNILNVRDLETVLFADEHPMTSASRLRDGMDADIRKFTADLGRPLILSHGKEALGARWAVPLAPDLPDRSAIFLFNLGHPAPPLDMTMVDVNGLASPLAAHLEMDERGWAGHEKWLPASWVVAEYADPAAVEAMPADARAQVAAARRALGCGALKELMDSVDEPMSVSRFWTNLVGSPARTALRVPQDPFEAERRFCG
jgi:arabinofuranosyltransferase